MAVFKGTAISGAVCIGKLKKYNPGQYPTFAKTISKADTQAELDKLKLAVNELEKSILASLEDLNLPQIDKEILEAHLMILTDIEIGAILDEAIKSKLMSAPQAVLTAYEKIIRNFEQMQNSYFAQRADDYKDVARQLMVVLLGIRTEKGLIFQPEDIVFLKDITPSLVNTLSKAGVRAYCSEHGSYTSHSSILTRALNMTAIVINDPLPAYIKDGDAVILDAENNYLILNPDLEQVDEYKNKIRSREELNAKLKADLSLPSQTKTGVTISIKANIEYPSEVHTVLENLCAGVGLFRTEFIYLNRNNVPDETEQTAIYSEILSRLPGLPVVIRTFDLGGDKLSFLQKYSREENPNLGCRGIRFSLQESSIFKTQIRAILKAAKHGKAAIMFPMVICADDYKVARKVVTECMEELNQEGISFDTNIPVGAMIETPSAALCAEQLAGICDFFSIGTNDLVQYTLAVDRNNNRVAKYYIQHHPAVLNLIQHTIKAAHKAGIPVSICGEMAAEKVYVPLLVGLGITELSINPIKSAEVKAIIRNCDDALYHKVQNFNFNTDLASVENFIFNTLKPYHTIIV